jgi:hypothetical protein
LYRWRREDRDKGVLNLRELAVQISRDGVGGQRRITALIKGLEGVKTMPLFGLLVNPLIDRPGKAIALFSTPGCFRQRSVTCV